MVCPKCHFALSPFDVDCPRCRNFAALGIAVPALPQTAGDSEAEPTIPDTAANIGQSTPVVATDEPWYSKLDLGDEISSVGVASKAEPAQEIVAKPVEIVSTAKPVEIVSTAKPAEIVSTAKPAEIVSTISPSPIEVSRPFASNAASMSKPPPTRPAPIYTPSNANKAQKSKQRLDKKVVFLLSGFAVFLGLAFVVLRTLAATHVQQTKANQLLIQAKGLIAQAQANAIQFQQIELTPTQAAKVLHTGTAKYQEALRLSHAAQLIDGGEKVMDLESVAVIGLRRVQADTEAQAARVLIAEVAESITAYKGKTLTDEQAASIRATLRTKCHSALADCTQSLQSDPDNSVALAERVLALRYLGDTKSADSAFAQAITLCPNNPVLLAAKGDHG